MKNYDEIKNKNTKERVVAKKLFENESSYFDSLIEQCTNENCGVIHLNMEQNYKYPEVYHYTLSNGLHVYRLQSEYFFTTEPISREELQRYYNAPYYDDSARNKSIKGSYVKYNKTIPDSSISFISYNKNTDAASNRPKVFEIRRFGYGPEYGTDYIYSINNSYADVDYGNPETMYDILELLHQGGKSDKLMGYSDGDNALALNRFGRIYCDLDRDEIQHYSDEELLIMQLQEENKQAKSKADNSDKTIAELQRKIDDLECKLEKVNAENNEILRENHTLKQRVQSLKSKLRAVKDFIVTFANDHKLFGKKLLEAFDEEIDFSDPDDQEQ